jgi:hypothetical protein
MKRSMWVVVAGLVVPAVVLASAAGDAQTKLLARRAAEADCYRKLGERIMGLRINATTLVRDFVTESDVIQTEVNTFIRGIKLGQPRYFADGSCEVTGEVAYRQVIACLQKIHTQHYKGNHLKASDFTTMSTRTNITMIRATGMGAPREDGPIDQPDGTVNAPAPEKLASPTLPGLWKNVLPRGRMMAILAARNDAYRRLAEQLRGFKITSNTSVRDFVAESDQINLELNTTLLGAREVYTYFHDDEPIVEVTVEIPWQQVIATIRDSYTIHIKNNHIKENVFDELSSRVEKKYFRATGMGIPPERYMGTAASEVRNAPPDWMNKPISATGQAAIRNRSNSTQAKLMATRAAELDAKRLLAIAVGGKPIDGNTCVADFIVKHDEIKSQLDAVIDGAYIKNTKVINDLVKVTVEVPGARVWKVISDEMTVQQKR